MRAVALRAFYRLVAAWGLAPSARRTLLGVSARTERRWRCAPERAGVRRDTLERISYIVGIHSGLAAIFSSSPLATEWVKLPNADFGGRPPLDRMLAGNVGDLAAVRGYVDAWRSGP